MPISWKAFWLAGWREYSDSALLSLLLSVSTDDVISAIDQNTQSLTLTTSAVETADFVDSGSESLVFSPSANEAAVFVDIGTEGLLFSPSASDILAAVDSNTEAFKLTPSVVESADFVDANTKSLALTPSASEVAVFVDSNTEGLVFTPSSTDAYQRTDYLGIIAEGNLSGTTPGGGNSTGDPTLGIAQEIQIGSTGPLQSLEIWIRKNGVQTDNMVVKLWDSARSTLLESWTIPAAPLTTSAFTRVRMNSVSNPSITPGRYWITYNRDGTSDSTNNWTIGNLGLNPVSQKVWPWNSTPNTIGTFPSSTNDTQHNLYIRVQQPTTAVTFTPSSTDRAAYVDASTETFAISPSATDTAQFVDSNTETFALSPTATDTAQFADTDSEVLVLTPTSSDVFAGEDSGTETVALTPTASESREIPDSGTEAIAMVPSATDIAIFVDADTEPLAFTPSGSDTQTSSSGGIDAATGSISLVPTASDFAELVDAAAHRLVFSILSTDALQTSDQSTGTVSLTPESFDVAEFIDAAVEQMLFTITVFEQSVGNAETSDAGAVALKLSGAAMIVDKIYDFTGVAFNRYVATPFIHWEAIAFKRAWGKLADMRWSSSLPFRRWWSST